MRGCADANREPVRTAGKMSDRLETHARTDAAAALVAGLPLTVALHVCVVAPEPRSQGRSLHLRTLQLKIYLPRALTIAGGPHGAVYWNLLERPIPED